MHASLNVDRDVWRRFQALAKRNKGKIGDYLLSLVERAESELPEGDERERYEAILAYWRKMDEGAKR